MSQSVIATVGFAISTGQIDQLRNSLKNVNSQTRLLRRNLDNVNAQANRMTNRRGQGLNVISGGAAAAGFGRTAASARVLGGALGVVAAAATVAGAALGGVAKISDDMLQLRSRIAQVSNTTDDVADTFERLLDISAETGNEVEETVKIFQRFRVATRAIGRTQEEVVRLTETLVKMGKIGGGSTQEINAGLIQLGQGLASGRLQGDELRSVLENMPVLAQELAKELGVTVGELRKLGAEGKLAADNIVPALERIANTADERFAKIPKSFARIFATLGVEFKRTMENIGFGTGLTDSLKNALEVATNLLIGFRDNWVGAWGTIKAVADSTLDAVKAAFGAFGLTGENIASGLSAAFGVLKSVLMNIAVATIFAFGLIEDGFKDLKTAFTTFGGFVKRHGEVVTKFFSDVIDITVDTLLKPFNLLIGTFVSVWQSVGILRGRIVESFDGMIDRVKGNFQILATAFSQILSGEFQAALDTLATKSNPFEEITDGLGDQVSSIFEENLNENWIQEGVKKAVDIAMPILEEFVMDMGSFFDNNDMFQAYLQRWEEAKAKIAAATQATKDNIAVHKELEGVMEETGEKQRGFWDIMLDGMRVFSSEYSNLLSGVSDALADNLVNSEVSWKETLGNINKAVDSFAQQIISHFIKMAIQSMILQPIFAAMGVPMPAAAGVVASAKGNVFSGGNVVPFAKGGVVNNPTTFPMRGGKTGLMSENAPEAIMPLTRGSDGSLGVRAVGGNSSSGTVINIATQVDASGSNDPSGVGDAVGQSIEKVVRSLVVDEMRVQGRTGNLMNQTRNIGNM